MLLLMVSALSFSATKFMHKNEKNKSEAYAKGGTVIKIYYFAKHIAATVRLSECILRRNGNLKMS